MKKVISLYALTMVLFITGCSKDNDDDNGPSERMQLITSASWKYENAEVDYDKNGTGDAPLPAGVLEDCDKDNIITLKADSTGTIDEGPTKCDPNDPQTIDITWEFKENETVINIPQNIFGNLSGDAKIKTLTSTKLTLIKEVTTPTNVNVILDLKH